MTQERASIELCRAAIDTHDEDGMVEIEAAILEDALDYLESESAAREKRMREVAEELRRAADGITWNDGPSPTQLLEWCAKLLEGLGAE